MCCCCTQYKATAATLTAAAEKNNFSFSVLPQCSRLEMSFSHAKSHKKPCLFLLSLLRGRLRLRRNRPGNKPRPQERDGGRGKNKNCCSICFAQSGVMSGKNDGGGGGGGGFFSRSRRRRNRSTPPSSCLLFSWVQFVSLCLTCAPFPFAQWNDALSGSKNG